MKKNYLSKTFSVFLPLLLLLVVILAPITTFAQSSPATDACPLPAKKTIGDLFTHVTCLIYKTVVPLFFALAIALFLWGVVQYIVGEGDETKRDKGKQFMLWGLIGLTVMVSVWALVAVLGSTFGLPTNTMPSAPE